MEKGVPNAGFAERRKKDFSDLLSFKASPRKRALGRISKTTTT